MAGLLVGGLFWGILGDRKGRLAVLFGSILTYSIANLLNGGLLYLPHDAILPAYGALRFIAGIGLAGELGAAVTLVSEACSRERRGLATAFVASMGIAGAVFAGWVSEHTHWTQAYIVGGLMGLALLLARVGLVESELFASLEKNRSAVRGDWWSLLIEKRLRGRYLGAIAQGMPIWFGVGVLLTFSPEIAKELRVVGDLQAGRAIMYCYGGAVAGDFLAGVWSQVLRSRRKAIGTFLLMTAVGMGAFLRFYDHTAQEFYHLAGYIGFASGYWAVLLSSTAEQFGTNIRATVSSTVPNFIRATVIPLSSLFGWLGAQTSLLTSATVLSSLTLVVAGVSLFRSRETFGADLNFVEEQEPIDAVLYFDGDCNLCNRVVDFCVSKGLGGRIRFASLQGETASRQLPPELRGSSARSLVLVENGEIQLRSQAALRIGVLCGGALGFASLIATAIPRVCSDLVYGLIAANRLKWFGRRETCRIPRPEERSWFLD
jgi:predicted DCC family thiol-disulfide oxidoreductase YuxK/MFS family permease